MHRHNRPTYYIFFTLLVTLVTFLAAILHPALPQSARRFPPGRRIGWVAVGGQNLAGSTAQLASWQKRPLTLVWAGRAISVSLEQAGLRFDPRATAAAALRFGGVTTPLFHLDRQDFQNLVADLDRRFGRPPGRISYRLAAGRPEVVPGKPGRAVDAPSLLRLLEGAIGSTGPLQIPVRPIPPPATPDPENLPIRFLLGEATTRYAPVPAGRVHNLRLAVGRLNSLVLAPGADFSFNEKIGPYTEANGYLPAPSIAGNRFVPGVGGGVCQVASTLYDAVIAAGLAVLERHNHTLAVNYLPPGFDATVAPGGIDLRFVNDLGRPVLILVESRDGTLRVSLWGPRPSPLPARLETRILKVIPPPVQVEADPSLPPGTDVTDDKGQPGYLVERWLMRGGHRLPLPADHYLARPSLVRQGPPVTAAGKEPAPGALRSSSPPPAPPVCP